MRLVLCDDHGLLVEALRCTLQAEGHVVVATAATPDAGVRAVQEHAPDACLMDLSFPSGSCRAAVAAMRVLAPSTDVIILSGTSDAELVCLVLEAGACTFVRKDQPVTAILGALASLQQEVRIPSPATVSVPAPRAPAPGSTSWLLQFLTDRERQVLVRILAGESTDEMARAMDIAKSTARTHVQNVLLKLGVHSRLQAAALLDGVRVPELQPH